MLLTLIVTGATGIYHGSAVPRSGILICAFVTLPLGGIHDLVCFFLSTLLGFIHIDLYRQLVETISIWRADQCTPESFHLDDRGIVFGLGSERMFLNVHAFILADSSRVAGAALSDASSVRYKCDCAAMSWSAMLPISLYIPIMFFGIASAAEVHPWQ